MPHSFAIRTIFIGGKSLHSKLFPNPSWLQWALQTVDPPKIQGQYCVYYRIAVGGMGGKQDINLIRGGLFLSAIFELHKHVCVNK